MRATASLFFIVLLILPVSASASQPATSIESYRVLWSVQVSPSQEEVLRLFTTPDKVFVLARTGLFAYSVSGEPLWALIPRDGIGEIGFASYTAWAAALAPDEVALSLVYAADGGGVKLRRPDIVYQYCSGHFEPTCSWCPSGYSSGCVKIVSVDTEVEDLDSYVKDIYEGGVVTILLKVVAEPEVVGVIPWGLWPSNTSTLNWSQIPYEDSWSYIKPGSGARTYYYPWNLFVSSDSFVFECLEDPDCYVDPPSTVGKYNATTENVNFSSYPAAALLSMIEINRSEFVYTINGTVPIYSISWSGPLHGGYYLPGPGGYVLKWRGGYLVVGLVPNTGASGWVYAVRPNTDLPTWSTSQLRYLKEPVLWQGLFVVPLTRSGGEGGSPGNEPTYLVAFDPETGQEVWEVPIAETEGKGRILSTCGPFLAVEDSSAEQIVLMTEEGDVVWRRPTGAFACDDYYAFISYSDENLTESIYLDNGSIRWSRGLYATLLLAGRGQSSDELFAVTPFSVTVLSKNGSLIQRLNLPLGYKAYPSVKAVVGDDGTLYVLVGGQLFAIGKSPSVSYPWWFLLYGFLHQNLPAVLLGISAGVLAIYLKIKRRWYGPAPP